jgi:hypothetical protein
MPADVRGDEGTDGRDLQAAGAHVVERAAHELGAEALALRLDLGVHERKPAGETPVADLARELAVVAQLVAQLPRVVRDLQHRLVSVTPGGRLTFADKDPQRAYDDTTLRDLWFALRALAVRIDRAVPVQNAEDWVSDHAGKAVGWLLSFVLLWGMVFLLLHLTFYPFPNVTHVLNPGR